MTSVALLAVAAGIALCAADSGGRADGGVVAPPARRAAQAGGAAGSLPLRASAPADEAAAAAVERALDWLAARQAEEIDGSQPPVGAEKYAPVALTALGALAALSAGNAPERGPHGRSLARGIDYLLAHVDRLADSPERGYIHDDRDRTSHMHGHGFATLALAEAYSFSPKTARGRRIEEALRLAVERIEVSQGVDGGWYYQPRADVLHENSVTICVVQALRAAKGAGIRVNPDTIARAVDYVKRSQKEDGSFRYALGREDSSVALTAAAISTLNATGIYGGSEVGSAYDFVARELAARAVAGERSGLSTLAPQFPYYERLYLAQALWQHPERARFDRWAGAERARVLSAQRADGSWGGSPFGDAYATAVNVLFLTLPQGLLPIFQR
ncbi:MAG: prenyltransferase/squalene oxidase repeat-containing protein [Planctomycetota bacterium]|jgi:hypothetical protein|nr:prenyltransferase/squalene oxidase repeat-containing protein [Planctomycetota bacterium]MDP6763833.1 prenyltransferase/squalene oxidase repeat-containing protein [Planctomycetota bacterium]MDP6989053.1 prenyltransferase/squalene oxidase repeat-containing protein [Planctomycetota bacterium]